MLLSLMLDAVLRVALALFSWALLARLLGSRWHVVPVGSARRVVVTLLIFVLASARGLLPLVLMALEAFGLVAGLTAR